MATLVATPLVRRLAAAPAVVGLVLPRAAIATAAVPPRGFRAAGVVAGIKKRQVCRGHMGRGWLPRCRANPLLTGGRRGREVNAHAAARVPRTWR